MARRSPGPVPYRPGLDGVRALAVAAVVAYHADAPWLPAGFLGVDVFFVLSGYLITSLLLHERAGRGRVDLRRFWVQRARRLLPALAAVLVSAALAALVAAPDAAARLRGDALAALAGAGNWWQVVRGESYFEALGRPPLLRHLWSLGVEAQFYLLFPVVFAGALRAGGGRRRWLAGGAVAAALASATWTAVLFDPHRDPSRVYYGTDTRAVGLLAGVALACVWPPGALRDRVRRSARAVLDLAGLAALAGLAVLMARLDDTGPALYRGGFTAAAAASVVLAAVAAHPASRVGAFLGRQPLRWIGSRSYAIYLWHWPVFVLTRPGLDVDVHGAPLLALRLAVTAVLAEASWRLVEQPVRSGRALAWWRSRPQLARVRLSFAGAAGVLAIATALVSSAPAPVPSLLAGAAGGATPSTLARIPPPATTAVPATSTTVGPAPAAAPATTAPVPNAAPPGPAAPAGIVLAVGESVMEAARDALGRAGEGRVIVDAAVARQPDDGLDLLQRYRDAGVLLSVSAVVVHLGTNGVFGPNHFARLAALTEGVPRVVVVNVRVPRRWEAQTNGAIAAGVAAHPTMRLADWYAASAAPGVLDADGVHPTAAGARVYARVVLEQLQGLAPPAPPPTTTTSPPAPPPPPPGTTAPPASTGPPAPTTTAAAPDAPAQP